MKRLPRRSSWVKNQESAWDAMRQEFSVELAQHDGEEILTAAAETIEEAMKHVISSLDQVSRRGDRLLALCPFHDDRHAGSFYVNPKTGWYKCFACDASGGLYRLMEQLGLDDSRVRGQLKGVDFRVLSDFISGPVESERGSVLALPEALLRNYNKRPLRLVEKGHPKELIDAMDIGFDVARNRITYPVRYVTGELVAVQTRSMDPDDRQRWKFYRSEVLEDLGRDLVDQYGLHDYTPPRTSVFFNEHNVLSGMLSGHVTKPVVLCEGPGHVLRVLKTGFPCLGSFGVSLAEEQLDRLVDALVRVQRWTGAAPRLIIATDGDQAGRTSAFKTSLRIGPRADVRIARLPPGKDPEDLCVQQLRPLLLGAEPMRTYLNSAGQDGDWARETVAKFARSVVEAQESHRRREAFLRKKQATLGHKNCGKNSLPTHALLSKRSKTCKVC